MADPTLPYHLRRNSDPSTSHRAAMDIANNVDQMTKWASECVANSPGSTANELAQIYRQNDTRRIGKRLDGAVKLGLVRRGIERKCLISRKYCTTWWPTTT